LVNVTRRYRFHAKPARNRCFRFSAAKNAWSWDFVFDRTVSGSRLKWLSAVDEYTRECLALKVDRGITSENVIATLSELFAMRGVPRHIRGDNGPELIAQTLRRWLKKAGVGSLYSRRETRPAARGASGGPFGSQQRRSHPRGV